MTEAYDVARRFGNLLLCNRASRRNLAIINDDEFCVFDVSRDCGLDAPGPVDPNFVKCRRRIIGAHTRNHPL